MSEDVLTPLLSDSEYEFLLNQFDHRDLMVLQDIFRECHIDPEDPNPSIATSISFLVESQQQEQQQYQRQQQQQSWRLNETSDIYDNFNLEQSSFECLFEYPETKNSTSQAMINQRYQIMRFALNKDNNLVPRAEITIYEYYNMFRGKIRLQLKNREKLLAKNFDEQVDYEQIEEKIAKEKIHLLDYWNRQVLNRTNLTFQPEKTYRFQKNWPPFLQDVPEEYFSSDEINKPEGIGAKLETAGKKRRKRRSHLTYRKQHSKLSKIDRNRKSKPTSGKKGKLIDEQQTETVTRDEIFDSISNEIPDQLNEHSQSSLSSLTFDPEPELIPEQSDLDLTTFAIEPNRIPMQQLEFVDQQMALPVLSNERALLPYIAPPTILKPSTSLALVPVTNVTSNRTTEPEEETVNGTPISEEQEEEENPWNNLLLDLQIGLYNLNLAEELSTTDVTEIEGEFESVEDRVHPNPLLSVCVSLDKTEEDSKPLLEHCSRLFEIIKNGNPFDPSTEFCCRELRTTLNELKRVEGEFNPKLLYYESWIACFLDQEYSKAMRLCERTSYPDHLHRSMQEIWDHSLEMMESIRRNHQKLSSVQRFRLKQKHEYPDTIWDGKRVKYGMSVLHKKVLIFFYDNFSKNPTSAQKDRLAKMVNATPAHVSTFFKNRRSRSGDTRKGGKTLKQEITNSEWKILEEMLKSGI